MSHALKDILARSQVDVLAKVAWSNVLLAFDYDGTLAPIVDDASKARMRSRTRDLLERLARVYPCVVISGRAQADVMRRVRGTGVFLVMGNHGMEPWRSTESFAAQVRSSAPTLQKALTAAAGITIEDKIFSSAQARP